MKTLPIAEAKSRLSGLVDEVHARDEEVRITRNGRPVAVIVSADEFDRWKETNEIRADKALMKEIAAGLRALREGRARTYRLDELFD